jgi:hypothetical protein
MEAWKWSASVAGATILAAVAWGSTRPPSCQLPAPTEASPASASATQPVVAAPGAVPPTAAVAPIPLVPAPPVVPAQPAALPELAWDDCPACGMG